MWHINFITLLTLSILCVCSIIINFIQIVLYLTVKPFGRNIYYKINYYLCYSGLGLLCFIIDWCLNVEIYVCMDKNNYKKYFGKEHPLLISNHCCEIDWVLAGSLAEKLNILGSAKMIMKSGFEYLPASGLFLYLSDYIFLKRNYAKDKQILEDKMKILMNYPHNVTISINPEGTRFAKEKHAVSLQFAKERGLPLLKYHLTPKTRGFTTCLPILRQKLKAIYDITLVFNPDEVKPTAKNFLLGEKLKAYYYIKRIPIEEVPEGENGAAAFLHNLFVEKDEIVDEFYKTRDFKNVELIKMEKSYAILINAIVWQIFVISLSICVSSFLILHGYIIIFICCIILYVFGLFIMYKSVQLTLISNPAPNGLTKNSQKLK